MRCPHCRGEIPQVSHFCGVCGQDVTRPPTGNVKSGGYAGASRRIGATKSGSSSLFELPISAGARRARLGMLVALNLLLAMGGIALIHGYMNKRDLAAQAAPLAKADIGANSATSADPAPESPDQLATEEPAGKDSTARDAGIAKPAHEGEASGTQVPTKPSDPKAVDPIVDVVKNVGPPDAGAVRQPKRRVDAGRRRPKQPDNTTGPPSGNTTRRKPDAGTFAQPPPKESEEQEAERVRRLSAQIKLVVRRHQGQLNRCYQSALKVINPNDTLEGRIKVHFAVQPDGSARNITVISDSTGSVALSKCVVGLIGSWTFPSSGGDALPFIWPFDFQAPQ